MNPPGGHAARTGRARSEHVAARRLAAVALVVVVVAGVAVIDHAAPPPPAPARLALASAQSIPSAASPMSSWYCAGGTTGFGAQANTTVYVTNTGKRTVAGTMSTTVNTGKAPASSHQALSVPPGGTVAVPGSNLPGGYGASTLAFTGGGIGVTQVAAGPDGWSTAPCASAPSPTWFFAAGATTAGNQLLLALYNPASTDAVANVSFDTDAGVITPQPYQGLTVPAGQLVVENVGDYVQDRPTIATVVRAQSGQLVADQLQLTSTKGRSGLSLTLGAPTVRPQWQFAQSTNPSGSGSSVAFLVSNPGATDEKAIIGVGLAQGGVAPVTMKVPAKSVAAFTASTTNRIPHEVPYSVSISSAGGAGLVVARAVLAPDGAPLPAFGTMLGTPQARTHWLVPAPGAGASAGVPGAAVTSLSVSNPGPAPARVTVAPVAGNLDQAKVLLVKPHSLLVLSQAPVGGLATLEVRSDVPVAVEEDSAPSGAPGVASSTGLPFG